MFIRKRSLGERRLFSFLWLILRTVSGTGSAESICSLSGIWACWFICVSVCVLCLYNMRASLADVQKLLKGDNFPLITLMRYSAAVLSVISPKLGRTTHTLHMLADCQALRRALITKIASYEEMKREMRRRGCGVEWEEHGNCLHFVICAYFIEFSHDSARHSSLCLIVFRVEKPGW